MEMISCFQQMASGYNEMWLLSMTCAKHETSVLKSPKGTKDR